jgi:CRP-like cAMP-binding protein
MIAPKSSIAATLRRVPLFADLSDPELALVAERITVRQCAAGATIFQEGGACRELLIVQQGSVKLLKTAANGRQQLLEIERAGHALSEVPVFDGGAYPATALAVTDVMLLCAEAEHFRKICAQHPQVAMKVIKVLGHRLRRMGRLVESLVLHRSRAARGPSHPPV